MEAPPLKQPHPSPTGAFSKKQEVWPAQELRLCAWLDPGLASVLPVWYPECRWLGSRSMADMSPLHGLWTHLGLGEWDCPLGSAPRSRVPQRRGPALWSAWLSSGSGMDIWSPAFLRVLSQVRYWSPGDEATASHITVSGNRTSATLRGLKSHTPHNVAIRAYNSAGPGPFSTTANATTRKTRECPAVRGPMWFEGTM